MKFHARDTFFNGRLRIQQPEDGYRFSIDAVLLAHAVQPGPRDTVVDLGAGCGVISLILAWRHPQIQIHAVEIQEPLARLARSNVVDNQMDDRICVLQEDLKTLGPAMIAQPVQWVVSNPPYRKADSGRINLSPGCALARHEIAVTLDQVVAAARRLLPLSGRLAMIYPAERLVDVIRAMASAGIEPKLLRMVHSTHGSEARLVLLTGIRGGRPGVRVGPPLVIWEKKSVYSDEVAAMFEP